MAEKLCKRKGMRWRKRKRRKGKDGRWVTTRRTSEVEVGEELHGDSEAVDSLGRVEEEMEETCVICLEKVILDQDRLPLKCGYVFHKECFLMLTRYNSCCPTCRGKTFPEVGGLTIVTSPVSDLCCHSCNKEVRRTAARHCQGCLKMYCSACFPTTQMGLGSYCKRCLPYLSTLFLRNK